MRFAFMVVVLVLWSVLGRASLRCAEPLHCAMQALADDDEGDLHVLGIDAGLVGGFSPPRAGAPPGPARRRSAGR